MSQNPINLALRFFLELAALGTMGYWGWHVGRKSGLQILFILLIPLAAAAIWGIFRVPGDPGNAPVAIPGPMRLVLEGVFFGFAVWALADAGRPVLSWVLGITLVLHYLVSYDRIIWLIQG
jgi:hypothetical protein